MSHRTDATRTLAVVDSRATSGHHCAVAIDMQTLDRLKSALTTIVPESKYYALTLTADESGRICWSKQTQYAGPGVKPLWDLRVPSLVDPYKMRALWNGIGESCVVVGSEESLVIFLRVGGNALVEQELAQRRLLQILEPKECATGPLIGAPRQISTLPNLSLQHAPSKKMRMDVLRRDDFRCRVCGRRPADCIDLVLHVHHIKPFGLGGLTEIDNLITLCHTCHMGLDPHFEWRLFELLPGGIPIPYLDSDGSAYATGVLRYREIADRRSAYSGPPFSGDQMKARAGPIDA